MGQNCNKNNLLVFITTFEIKKIVLIETTVKYGMITCHHFPSCRLGYSIVLNY